MASSILAQACTHTPFIPYTVHARLILEVTMSVLLIIINGIMHTCTKLSTNMTHPIMNEAPWYKTLGGIYATWVEICEDNIVIRHILLYNS